MIDYQYVGMRGVSLPKHDMFGSISILFHCTVLWKIKKHLFENCGKLNKKQTWMYPRLSPTMMIGWVWLKLMWFKRAWTSLLLFNSNKPEQWTWVLSRYSILVIISIDLAMQIFSTMIVIIPRKLWYFFYILTFFLGTTAWTQTGLYLLMYKS